jgi:hypothetical protein
MDDPVTTAAPTATAPGGVVSLVQDLVQKATDAAANKVEDSPVQVLLLGVGVRTAPASIPQPVRFGFGLLSGGLAHEIFDGGALGASEEARIADQQLAENRQRIAAVAAPAVVRTLVTMIAVWNADP